MNFLLGTILRLLDDNMIHIIYYCFSLGTRKIIKYLTHTYHVLKKPLGKDIHSPQKYKKIHISRYMYKATVSIGLSSKLISDVDFFIEEFVNTSETQKNINQKLTSFISFFTRLLFKRSSYQLIFLNFISLHLCKKKIDAYCDLKHHLFHGLCYFV